jgi:hypothetical protein
MRRPSLATVLAGAALAVAIAGAGPAAYGALKRAAFADNAGRLGGLTLKQVRSGVDATRLAGHTASELRSGIDAATLSGQTPQQLRQGIDAATLNGQSAGDLRSGIDATRFNGETLAQVQSGATTAAQAQGKAVNVLTSPASAVTLAVPPGNWLVTFHAVAEATSTTALQAVVIWEPFAGATMLPQSRTNLRTSYDDTSGNLSDAQVYGAAYLVSAPSGTVLALNVVGDAHDQVDPFVNAATITALQVGTAVGAIMAS